MFSALVALALLSGGNLPPDLPYHPEVQPPMPAYPKPIVKPLPTVEEKSMIIGEPVEAPAVNTMPATFFRCVRDPSYKSVEYEVWVCARKKA